MKSGNTFKTRGWVEGQRASEERTPWAVRCPTHGLVYLTHEEYLAQMMRPDSRWECPACGLQAKWDDSNYEAFQDMIEESPE